jgi:hypothetical protein
MTLNNYKTNISNIGTKKRTLSRRIELGAASLICITVVMICTLSLAYLAHSNKIATRAYQLKSLEKEREALITQNELWNMKLSQAQALATIENDPKVASMVSITAPIYVRGDTAVAVDTATPYVN